MVSYVKSFCSEIYMLAEEFDQSDRFVDQETQREMTRNFIPIGTGTLLKMNVVGLTTVFLLHMSRAIAGCKHAESMNELTCQVIKNTMNGVAGALMATIAFQSSRLIRNVLDG